MLVAVAGGVSAMELTIVRVALERDWVVELSVQIEQKLDAFICSEKVTVPVTPVSTLPRVLAPPVAMMTA